MIPSSVALIGSGEQENLALGYLAAAVEEAGHRARILKFDTRDETERCVQSVLLMKPIAVGLGITYQYAVDDYLNLARELRCRGYPGHITCGGHLPTFCHREILTAQPALDTVVRHDGEETLVAILDALEQGAPVRDIPGLVWRTDNGIAVGSPRPPVADLDTLPRPVRRSSPMSAAGFPLAFVIASRGCMGECAYCSIRAFTKDAGGKRYRMRRPDAVAEELADLRRRLGVRVVLLEDDLFILPSERRTIERIEAISLALRNRGVTDLCFWVKGRPETLTAPVLEAAARMGCIHVFLGVENASLERLRYLGRRHTPADNERALRLCRAWDISPTFNVMLFDPDCTLEDVETNVAFAARHTDIPWNICRTEIYPGTTLYTRLQEEGRLLGDFRTLGYVMKDPRAEAAFRILRVAFKDRSFRFQSIHNRLITIRFANDVRRRLAGDAAARARYEETLRITREVAADTVRELHRIIDFVRKAPLDELDVLRDFALETAMGINERNHRWRPLIDELGE